MEGRCTLIDWSKGPSRKHRKRNIVEFHAQISVWGADDTVYAMWSSHDNEADARRAYEGYCRWLGRVAVLTQEIAKSVGFRVR